MTRTITIEPVLNGFVVQVGCQRVVFNNLESLCENIHRYYKDPSGVEKQFVRDCINKTLDGPAVAVPPPRGPVLQERIDAEVNRPYVTAHTSAPVCEPQCERPR